MGKSDKMLLRFGDCDVLIVRPGLLLLYMNHEVGSSCEFLLSVLAYV